MFWSFVDQVAETLTCDYIMNVAGDVGRYERGVAYAEKGHVVRIDSMPGQVVAYVQGSEQLPYIVTMDPVGRDCTCPDLSDGSCKHIVAVMHTIRRAKETGNDNFNRIVKMGHMKNGLTEYQGLRALMNTEIRAPLYHILWAAKYLTKQEFETWLASNNEKGKTKGKWDSYPPRFAKSRMPTNDKLRDKLVNMLRSVVKGGAR